jgi:hypothetical protein
VIVMAKCRALSRHVIMRSLAGAVAEADAPNERFIWST